MSITIFLDNEENIINFIKKYEHVAPTEIAEVFGMSKTEADETIQGLKKQKLVNIIPAGNGYFITPDYDPLLCDPETGACRI